MPQENEAHHAVKGAMRFFRSRYSIAPVLLDQIEAYLSLEFNCLMTLVEAIRLSSTDPPKDRSTLQEVGGFSPSEQDVLLYIRSCGSNIAALTNQIAQRAVPYSGATTRAEFKELVEQSRKASAALSAEISAVPADSKAPLKMRSGNSTPSVASSYASVRPASAAGSSQQQPPQVGRPPSVNRASSNASSATGAGAGAGNVAAPLQLSRQSSAQSIGSGNAKNPSPPPQAPDGGASEYDRYSPSRSRQIASANSSAPPAAPVYAQPTASSRVKAHPSAVLEKQGSRGNVVGAGDNRARAVSSAAGNSVVASVVAASRGPAGASGNGDANAKPAGAADSAAVAAAAQPAGAIKRADEMETFDDSDMEHGFLDVSKVAAVAAVKSASVLSGNSGANSKRGGPAGPMIPADAGGIALRGAVLPLANNAAAERVSDNALIALTADNLRKHNWELTQSAAAVGAHAITLSVTEKSRSRPRSVAAPAVAAEQLEGEGQEDAVLGAGGALMVAIPNDDAAYPDKDDVMSLPESDHTGFTAESAEELIRAAQKQRAAGVGAAVPPPAGSSGMPPFPSAALTNQRLAKTPPLAASPKQQQVNGPLRASDAEVVDSYVRAHAQTTALAARHREERKQRAAAAAASAALDDREAEYVQGQDDVKYPQGVHVNRRRADTAAAAGLSKSAGGSGNSSRSGTVRSRSSRHTTASGSRDDRRRSDQGAIVAVSAGGGGSSARSPPAIVRVRTPDYPAGSNQGSSKDNAPARRSNSGRVTPDRTPADVRMQALMSPKQHDWERQADYVTTLKTEKIAGQLNANGDAYDTESDEMEPGSSRASSVHSGPISRRLSFDASAHGQAGAERTLALTMARTEDTRRKLQELRDRRESKRRGQLERSASNASLPPPSSSDLEALNPPALPPLP